jgi:hypothetical protein
VFKLIIVVTTDVYVNIIISLDICILINVVSGSTALKVVKEIIINVISLINVVIPITTFADEI